jgi:hypothetical protein
MAFLDEEAAMGKMKIQTSEEIERANRDLVNSAAFIGRGENILNVDGRLNDAYETILANGQKLKPKKNKELKKAR